MEYDLSSSQKKEIKDTFDIFKMEDNPNYFNASSLKTAMMSFGLTPGVEEIKRINNQLETPGLVSLNEFTEIIALRIATKKPKRQINKKIFSLISDKANNKFTSECFKKLMERFRENLSDMQIRNILESADIDYDGEVNESDFLKVLENTNFL